MHSIATLIKLFYCCKRAKKSLGAIMLELAEKGMEAAKGGK
jgi:hypothetical protein